MKITSYITLSLLALSFVLFTPVQAADHVQKPVLPEQSTQSNKAKFVKIIADVGLATLAHIVSEYFILNAHEHGHCFGSKISNGNYGEVKIEFHLHKHPLAILLPFTGYSMSNNGNKTITLAMGPLAGILASYGFMAAAEGICAALDGDSAKNITTRALKRPITVYPTIANNVKELIMGDTSKSISLSSVFSTTFAFFKTSRIIGEIIYGFTPYEALPNSDGVKLWQSIYKKSRPIKGSPVGGVLMSASPTFMALGTGFALGIYQLIKRKLSSN